MDLEDISMTESCGLKSSSLSCRLSTEFGNSGSSNQKTSKPIQLGRQQEEEGSRSRQGRYQCYECAGDALRSQ